MFDSTYAKMEENWRSIIEFGPRPFGSSPLAECSAYLFKELEKVSVSVKEARFIADGFSVNSWSLKLLGDDGREPQSYVFLGSGSSAGFRGRLRYAGKNRVWDMYSWDRYAVTDESHAIQAYITVRGNGGAIPQMLAEGNTALPHLIVGQEESAFFAAAAEKGMEVEGHADTACVPGAVGRDLVATLSPGRKRVLLCAHYDTVYNTPGAYDNSSGPAVLLEVARRLRGRALRTGLEIAFMDGEEMGLLGSAYLARTQAEGIEKVINIDGVGRDRLLEVWAGPEAFERTLRQYFDASPEVRRSLYTCPPPPGSDQAPYYALGVPACTLTFNDQAILHSPLDVYAEDKLDNMAVMARLVIGLLEHLGVTE